jgi:hypothetical protein
MNIVTNLRLHAMLITALVSSTACSEGQMASPGAIGARAVPPQSRGLFVAALDHFVSGSEGRLLVDPRPLRPDVDLGSVTAADIAAEDAASAEFRAHIVRERGLGLTDAVRDQRCAFVRGVTLPDSMLRLLPDSVRRRREECLARESYTSVIFGTPRPVGEQRPGVWRLEAVRMTTWKYGIWDLYLRPSGRGDWVLLEAKERFVIAS